MDECFLTSSGREREKKKKNLSLQQPFTITIADQGCRSFQTCAREYENLQVELIEFKRSLNIQNIYFDSVGGSGILCLSQTVALGP